MSWSFGCLIAGQPGRVALLGDKVMLIIEMKQKYATAQGSLQPQEYYDFIPPQAGGEVSGLQKNVQQLYTCMVKNSKYMLR